MHAIVVVQRADPVNLCESCLRGWQKLAGERLTAALAEYIGRDNNMEKGT